MINTALEEVPTKTSDNDDNLEHYYCECDDSVALCGADITDAPDHTASDTPFEDDCVVCIDLVDAACLRCGRP